jgi:chromosome segregation ATPase
VSTDETREMAALHNYISMLLVDRADLVDALKRAGDEHDATYAELRTARLNMDAIARGEGLKHLTDLEADLRIQVERLTSRLDNCKQRLKVAEENASELLGRVVTADAALEEAIDDANVLATYIAKYARSNVAIRSPIVLGRGTFEAKVTAAYNRARKRMDG